MFRLTIQLPQGERTLEVAPTDSARLLTELLREREIPLNTRCGQRGLCNGCMVEFVAGELQHAVTGTPWEAADPPATIRGCEALLPVEGHAVIHVPSRSLLAHRPQVVKSFRLNVPRAHDPLWQPLTLAAEELDPQRDWVEAVRAAAAAGVDDTLPLEVDPHLNGQATGADGVYRFALEYLGDRRRLGASQATAPEYGAAIDVGTTTVVVMIVELATGHIVSSASALNAQARLGDNVLTRINVCMQSSRFVARLQQALVRGTLMPLLSEALTTAELAPEQLACIVVAGNTTMLHLLHGVDPSSLGVAPFTPTFLDHRTVDARELGLEVRGRKTVAAGPPSAESAESDGRRVTLHTLPGVAAYVGADIAAGVLASGMAYRDDTTLLVDLGTNGEIVLAHHRQLLGCATAAGPAFEGAGLTFGVRAGHGAIGHIRLEPEHFTVHADIIGDVAPHGICGTAYIDFIAQARRVGLITPTARFTRHDLPGITQHGEHGWAFVVASDTTSGPVLITEADMASLLQAKAAIAAGVACLLRRAGITPADVTTVFLAGGFGFHMHIDSLLGCGMLPGFQPDQVELVGNTSLAGAYLALLDSHALHEMRQVAQRTEIIELNLEPDFEATYIEQLALPDR